MADVVEAVDAAVVDAEVVVVRPRVGMGWRKELDGFIATNGGQIECLEVTAEHFYDTDYTRLRELARDFELYVHGIQLSLGTPGPLDQNALSKFVRVANEANAAWVSEHISYTRFGGKELGHLNPVPRTAAMVDVIADHAKEVADACGKPIILENITAHLDPGGDMSEAEFVNAICQRADCGLLLDLTNLMINSRNHGYDCATWLNRIDTSRIWQTHIVGYSYKDGVYEDHHSARIQDDLLELLDTIIDTCPVRAIILERDEKLDETVEIAAELKRLSGVVNAVA